MNDIVKASYTTLSKSKQLLSKLSNSQLCNQNISPYYSSIGSHIRHILDFYNCIFNGIKIGVVDLTQRERNLVVEKNCNSAIDYLETILSKLEMSSFKTKDSIVVVDDLGQGKVFIDYTIGSLLAQANSHTIHHYAIINYILDQLGIKMEDETFGFNPTSPRKEMSNNH